MKHQSVSQFAWVNQVTNLEICVTAQITNFSGDGGEAEPERGMSYLQPSIMFEVEAIVGGLQDRHDAVLQEDTEDAPEPTPSQPEGQDIGKKHPHHP